MMNTTDQIARAMAMDAKATADSKASLVDGKIPAAQLPSYVDDVVEYASASAFPATGESGKIYIALDTNKSYRWSGTEYIPILSVDIWTGTRAQYEALQTDDYDYYFVTEGAST